MRCQDRCAGEECSAPPDTPAPFALKPPEYIDGYEVGLKVDYLDRRARTNIAVFYDEIEDPQVAAFLGLQFAVFNAPSAKLYGAEIENTFRLSDALTLDAAATYLPHAEYGESARLGPSLSGRRFTNAPTFSGNVALRWEHPIDDDLRLTGRAACEYQTRIFTNPACNAVQGGYGLVNLSVGVASDRKGWSLEAFCQNCADKTHYSFHYQMPVQTGSEGAYLGPPDVWRPTEGRFLAEDLHAGTGLTRACVRLEQIRPRADSCLHPARLGRRRRRPNGCPATCTSVSATSSQMRIRVAAATLS
jgi:iron complex outermembrane recepter protein